MVRRCYHRSQPIAVAQAFFAIKPTRADVVPIRKSTKKYQDSRAKADQFVSELADLPKQRAFAQ
jgi:hypothetical protein